MVAKKSTKTKSKTTRDSVKSLRQKIDDLESEVLKIDDDNISESKLLLILRLLERNIIEVNIK